MDHDTPAVETSKMTKLQKLAALMIILGPEGAAQILKIFDDHELEAISSEMSKLTMISQELQCEILPSSTRKPCLRPKSCANCVQNSSRQHGLLYRSID